MQGCTLHQLPKRQQHTANLAQMLQKANPNASKKEIGALVARIKYSAQRLHIAYDRHTHPWIHNLLVNLSIKQKGLCWHFSDALYLDLLKAKSSYPSFCFHLIVSKPGSFWEHNGVAIVDCKGDLQEGVVVDLWRKRNSITYYPLTHDPEYRWRHRHDRCLCAKKGDRSYR